MSELSILEKEKTSIYFWIICKKSPCEISFNFKNCSADIKSILFILRICPLKHWLTLRMRTRRCFFLGCTSNCSRAEQRNCVVGCLNCLFCDSFSERTVTSKRFTFELSLFTWVPRFLLLRVALRRVHTPHFSAPPLKDEHMLMCSTNAFCLEILCRLLVSLTSLVVSIITWSAKTICWMQYIWLSTKWSTSKAECSTFSVQQIFTVCSCKVEPAITKQTSYSLPLKHLK